MIANAVPHKRVEYGVAKYDTTLADQSVDLVTVAQALHWLDLEPFLKEARRVLVPGGVLAACWRRAGGVVLFQLPHGARNRRDFRSFLCSHPRGILASRAPAHREWVPINRSANR